MLAPDEGCHAHRARCLEAADVLRLAQHRPHGDGRPKTFQDLRPQRLQLERAAQQSPRRLCDHKASRFGQRLQSRGQIGRLADDGLFLRRALSDKVADHNDPRGDADADLEIFVRPRFELRDDGRDVEASPYRPLGVVLMGLGIAEIDEDAVAHVLRHEPAEALHGLGDTLLISGNDLAEVFRVHAG